MGDLEPLFEAIIIGVALILFLAILHAAGHKDDDETDE